MCVATLPTAVYVRQARCFAATFCPDATACWKAAPPTAFSSERSLAEEA